MSDLALVLQVVQIVQTDSYIITKYERDWIA